MMAILLLIGLTQAATLTVCPNERDCKYTKIQAAIDAASVNDTIEVDSGVYFEDIVLRKQLTIRGINTGIGLPMIDGTIYLCGHDAKSVVGITFQIRRLDCPENDTEKMKT
jgi:pectin methylesterase-like acyl-CoA thioesterase